MSTLKGYAKITNEKMDELVKNGSVVGDDGTVYELDDEMIYITPPKMASTEEAGIIKLATDEDITTGTDTSKAVTPAQLKTAIEDNVPEIDTSNLVDLTSEQKITGTKKFNRLDFSYGINIKHTSGYEENIIGNSTTGNIGGIFIGDNGTHYSSVTGRNNVAIGNNTKMNGRQITNSIVIGNSAQITNDITTGNQVEYAIQIGEGNNITSNSVQIWDYQMLDKTTGKIPNERLNLEVATTDEIDAIFA